MTAGMWDGVEVWYMGGCGGCGIWEGVVIGGCGGCGIYMYTRRVWRVWTYDGVEGVVYTHWRVGGWEGVVWRVWRVWYTGGCASERRHQDIVEGSIL